MSNPVAKAFQKAREITPGLLLCALIGATSTLISQSYGGPLFLYALLLGMAFNSLFKGSRLEPGIKVTTTTILRAGVALMGFRLGLDTVFAMGAGTVLTVALGVALTIGTSLVVGKLLGRNQEESVLGGGAVAICGASAAMAISAALPPGQHKEKLTLFVVVGVTALSTVCMVLYPMLAYALEFTKYEAALLFGATIHEVAQVVGTAMLFGEGTAESASYVKLLRVAFLAPVVLGVSLWFRKAHQTADSGKKPKLIPTFLIFFFVFFAIANLVSIPAPVQILTQETSRTFVLLAIAGLGVKTSLFDMKSLGWRPIALLFANTVALLIFVLVMLKVVPLTA